MYYVSFLKWWIKRKKKEVFLECEVHSHVQLGMKYFIANKICTDCKKLVEDIMFSCLNPPSPPLLVIIKQLNTFITYQW